VDIGDILYAEALKNYVRIATKQKTHLVLLKLSQLDQMLPKDLFCQIHRSYIISIAELTSFDRKAVFLGKHEIPIGNTYRDVFFQRIKKLINHDNGNSL